MLVTTRGLTVIVVLHGKVLVPASAREPAAS
jgi:hypothetical protein